MKVETRKGLARQWSSSLKESQAQPPIFLLILFRFLSFENLQKFLYL